QSRQYLHLSIFFSFNAPAPTEIYTLCLHDALPISRGRARRSSAPRRAPARGAAWPPPRGPGRRGRFRGARRCAPARPARIDELRDRKSTRLNSSHVSISYAVFCLKKKKLGIVKTTT